MRHEDWQKRLRQAVAEWRDKPFVWGDNDCCMFAARCVDAVTGSSWVDDLKSCYHDEKSARAYIDAQTSIHAAVTRRLGFPVPKKMARRGDVCYVETETGPSLAVCVGAHAVGPGIDRQYAKPMSEVICAWRID